MSHFLDVTCTVKGWLAALGVTVVLRLSLHCLSLGYQREYQQTLGLEVHSLLTFDVMSCSWVCVLVLESWTPQSSGTGRQILVPRSLSWSWTLVSSGIWVRSWYTTVSVLVLNFTVFCSCFCESKSWTKCVTG